LFNEDANVTRAPLRALIVTGSWISVRFSFVLFWGSWKCGVEKSSWTWHV